MVTVGFMIGLASIGLDFSNFAPVAGAIGYGLQSSVNNFVSSLILLFERTLQVGDFVELASGVAGEVRATNVRSTLINTNDNIDIVVPNSKFTNDNVINWPCWRPTAAFNSASRFTTTRTWIWSPRPAWRQPRRSRIR